MQLQRLAGSPPRKKVRETPREFGAVLNTHFLRLHDMLVGVSLQRCQKFDA
jgi:hypothetical protein